MKIIVLRLLIPAVCLIPSFGAAEIYNCSGVWTNQPCEDESKAVLEEKPVQKRTEQELQMDQKELWLHDLEMKRLDAKRNYKIDIDTTIAKQVCSDKESELTECRKEIDKAEELLVRRTFQQEKLSAKKASEEPKPAATSQTIVYIDNTRDTVGYPYDYYHHKHKHGLKHSHKHTKKHGETSLSVELGSKKGAKVKLNHTTTSRTSRVGSVVR
jgi:hypothetical protein